MVIVVVGLCMFFILSSILYFVTKQLLDMSNERKYPEPENPDPGGSGGSGNSGNPDPGDKK